MQSKSQFRNRSLGPWFYRNPRSSAAEDCCSGLTCNRPARTMVCLFFVSIYPETDEVLNF